MLLIPNWFRVEFLQSADSMSLRLSTVHENSLGHHSPFVFTSTTGYFHGSEGSVFLRDTPGWRIYIALFDVCDEQGAHMANPATYAPPTPSSAACSRF
jgi:hypothetical protein